MLNATFTPTDVVDYTTATASVTLTEFRARRPITITSSAIRIPATAAVPSMASLPS